MIKKPFLAFSFLLAFLLLTGGILSGQHNVSQHFANFVDKSSNRCGYHYILEHQNEIKRNTRILHPNLPQHLKKGIEVEHEVGDTLQFYVVNFQTSSREKTEAVCRYKSQRTYIFVGLDEWNKEKVDQSDVENFYESFEVETPAASIDPDKGIRDIEEEYFGSPPNKSGDGYIYILIYDIEDGYDPNTSTSYVAGYFSPTDQTNTSYSNQKDMIYVDCDPADPSSKAVLSTVAHEFQHLIHYGLDPAESSSQALWVNEGASEYAEYLCGYGLRNPSRFLHHPERSLIKFGSYENNVLIDYAKVALWTYYLAEKFGPDLIGRIVRNPAQSISGVRNALSNHGVTLSFEEIFSNFVIANYADNPTIGENSYYGYEKLNLPILAEVSHTHNVYPVAEHQRNLGMYSSAYYRFTATDTTAVLSFEERSQGDINPQIYQIGEEEKVAKISLDENLQGEYNLSEIGKTASEILLIPTSLSTSTSYYYSVSSDIEDIYAPKITSGPSESLPTGNSVTIVWETDELATSIVEYGTTEEYGSVVEDTHLVVSHQVVLKNLQKDTTYHYRVGSADNRGNGPTFSVDFIFSTTSLSSKTVISVAQTHSHGYQGRNIVRNPEGTIHLIYHEMEGERRFVYHIKSSDDGKTWSSPVQIDATLYYGGMPSVAMDSFGTLHVAWHAKASSGSNYNIYYSQSDDGGATWSQPKNISQSLPSKDKLYAAVAIDTAGHPHVVWNSSLYQDAYMGDVYHNVSYDGGDNWAGDQKISTSDQHRCFVPTIDFMSNGTAYVFYSDGDFDSRSKKVYFVSSSDYQQWTTQEAVSHSGVLYDGLISFVIDPADRIHVVFSDNYTPGDIRIMYTQYDAGSWEVPAPVAQSVTGGNVNYPNIGADEHSDLYLVYRDDMSNGSMGKLRHIEPNEESRFSLKKVGQTEQGDVFLTIHRDDFWLPATNLSNDSPDSQYPEIAERLYNGVVDLIWMNNVSSTNHLKFMRFDTKSSPKLPPPQISSTSPENGAENVSYFNEVLKICVVFNQRIEKDSLVSGNVKVVSSENGMITGEIIYNESQRQMEFIPAEDLSPNDQITIQLTTDITNNAGLGLDGNGNGISEGSPTDDYVWEFTTQSLDTQSPTFTIGILQHPVLTRYMDIYVIASEHLAGLPTLEVGEESVSLIAINTQSHIYKGDYKLEQEGVIRIQTSGEDLAGNTGNGMKDFSAQLLIVDQGGTIHSPDDLVQLNIPPTALQKDAYLTVTRDLNQSHQKEDEQTGGTYKIGPASLELNQPAELRFQIPENGKSEGVNFTLERKKNNGSWEKLQTSQVGKSVTVSIRTLGTFRLIETEKMIPVDFSLQQNYPNPFALTKQETTLHYEIPFKAGVKIFIYNILGKRIKTLVNRVQDPGHYQVRWDGTDEQNRQVAGGLYFYQLQSKGTVITKKLIVLR